MLKIRIVVDKVDESSAVFSPYESGVVCADGEPSMNSMKK